MTAAEAVHHPGATAVGEGLLAALAAVGTGTWRWDLDTGIVVCDAALEKLLGFERGQFPGTYDAWLATVHPEDAEGTVAAVEAAMERGGSFHIEHRAVWPDGSVHWLEWRGLVLTDDQGQPMGTEGCVIDFTHRKITEMAQDALLAEVRDAAARLSRLQRTSRHLTAALTVDDVVGVFLNSDSLDAPPLATARAIWILDPGGSELVLAGQVGMVPVAALRFERIGIDEEVPAAVAMRERRTVVSPSEEDSLERFPALEGVPRSGQGFVAVPLLVESRALGVLAFGYDGTLEDDEIAFLEAASGNIAQTLQRARLAGALERRSTEVAFLSDVTRAAISASDHRDLMRRIAETTVPRLGDICAIHFVPEPGGEFETVAVHADPRFAKGAAELASRLLWAGGPHSVVEVMDRGTTEFTRDLLPRDFDDPDVLTDGEEPVSTLLEEFGITSAITVPMYADGQAIGALQVLAGPNRTLQSEREVALAEAMVLGMSDALASRWLTDQHRYISDSLQRAFLPPVTPELPRVDIATAYWPAGEASQVGGDFYDVFAIDETTWALVIGDACGTGPDAAATAAIARHTARAAARHGLGHHEVLEWVNQAVKHSDRDLFCTACYATMKIDPELDTIEVTVAAGGHPLPIVTGHGKAQSLGAPGTLLGIFEEPVFETRSHLLAPGEGLVLYTDGVTDLPDPYGRTPEELETILANQELHRADEALDVLADDLAQRAEARGRADDVAVLVVWYPDGEDS